MSPRLRPFLAALLAALALSVQAEEPARVVVFGTVQRLTARGAPVRQLDDAAFDQDLAELVAKAAGLPYRIDEFKTAPEVLAALEGGTIDVIPSYGRVPERVGKYLFSVRHTVSTAAVFMREGRPAPATLADVAALRLVAARDSSATSYARRKGLIDHLELAADTDAALLAVASGRADACLSNQLVGLSVGRRLGLDRKVVPVFTLPDSSVDFCMAVRLTDGELLTRLNDGLLIASERGDLQRHREQWLPVFESYWLAKPATRRWFAFGGVALVCAVLLTWRWYRVRLQAEHRLTEEVSRLVDLRTRELESTVAQLRSSEEAVRRLNGELETRVGARTAELAQRVAQVEQLNAELESFSYSVSHDLRAPLRNITGFVELLERRTSDRLDAEERRFVATVTSESKRMGKLIDELLAFSRLGRAEMKRQRVDLGGLIAEVQAELAPEIGARRIEWEIAALPAVHGDRTLVRQVMGNLLSNAVKFTRRRDPARIRIGAIPEPGGAMIAVFVQDNGAGFNPKYAEKLFGVFQRLHNQRDFEGTGIGLANVKRIVLRHGGRVWAEGSVDNGATFNFTLPVSPS